MLDNCRIGVIDEAYRWGRHHVQHVFQRLRTHSSLFPIFHHNAIVDGGRCMATMDAGWSSHQWRPGTHLGPMAFRICASLSRRSELQYRETPGQAGCLDSGYGNGCGCISTASNTSLLRIRPRPPRFSTTGGGSEPLPICNSSSTIDMTARMFVVGRRVLPIVISRKFTGSFCHPWRPGPGIPYRNDGSGKFRLIRLKRTLVSEES